MSDGVKVTDFLAALFPDEDEDVRLRAFKPKDAPSDDPRFTARKWLTTRRELSTNAALRREIIEYNKTRGIYFVVNSGGDTKEEITRFNAWFAEDDRRSIEEQHKLLDEAPLPPSIRIETRKSVHAYWLISGDCNAEEWGDIQQRLIAHFGSDAAISDASRVMRLPLFNHVHYEK